MYGVGCIDAQVTKNVVVLWVSRLEVAVQGFGRLLAAGDEASFIRIDLEASSFQVALESSVGQNSFSSISL